MIQEFFNAMKQALPPEGRIMLCQFRGDPNADIKGKWRARVLNDVSMIDEGANVYLCVSAMKKNDRNEFRRRKENFAGGLLLMIDDLGTGKGAKFPMSTIDAAPPTALIETSPDNFQAIYMFKELVSDMKKFEALIRSFIQKEFLGKDTGMAGVNRVFRPPAGVNGKPKYGGWNVRMDKWSPENRYTVEELATAFNLELKMEGPRVPKGATVNKSENIRAFIQVRSALRSAGMMKKDEADMAGWTDMRCPWTHEHTGAMDNGAAIRIPDADNSWYGAFKCHHGSCEHRGWRDLTEWLAEGQEDILAMVNMEAGEFSRYEIQLVLKPVVTAPAQCIANKPGKRWKPLGRLLLIERKLEMKTPTFPHMYLSKEVSPRTAARKARDGICKHWGCTRIAREGARDCETCHSRKAEIKNPRRRAYRSLKSSAKRRGIDFSLTYDEFVEFDKQTGYVASKGQSAECLSVDRIDPTKGYEVGNIRALTWIENCRRKIDGMTDPAEPIARALAKERGHDIHQRCANEANAILVMVELLLAQQDGGFDAFEDPFDCDDIPF